MDTSIRFASAADRRRSLFTSRDALAARILAEPLPVAILTEPVPAPPEPVILALADAEPAAAFKDDRELDGMATESCDLSASSENAAPVEEKPVFTFRIKRPPAPHSWWRQRKRRRLLVTSNLFDRDWYLDTYPDVRAAGIDPLQHFLDYGTYEGRSPGPAFDAVAYLRLHPDVVAANVEPWLHYVNHGRGEGRVTA